VVARVRRILGTRAVGHTGTLDPFATGLLVVLVGRATRVARFVEGADKTYLAVALLGVRTTTDDRTGTPVGAPASLSGVDEAAVRDTLAELGRSQRQRPPAYSAKRVAGERSYRLARQGHPVDLAEVPVTVHRIELVEWRPPEATFRATVSAGTYLRALGRDLGEALGVGAHLTALRREAIGLLRVEDALPLERLEPATPLLPLRGVLAHLRALELDDGGRAAVRHGRAVPAPAVGRTGGQVAGGEHVALLAGSEVIAVARSENGWLKPVVVLEAP
jgi:tRNA pseudouridine55 synthase